MKSIIQGKEVIKFLEFLHQEDQLEQVIPEMEVPEHLIIPYMTYKLDAYTSEVSTPAVVRSVEQQKFKNGMKSWSKAQLNELKTLIQEGLSITDISTVMGRSPSAVRKKAYYALNFTYSSETWKYLGEQ